MTAEPSGLVSMMGRGPPVLPKVLPTALLPVLGFFLPIVDVIDVLFHGEPVGVMPGVIPAGLKLVSEGLPGVERIEVDFAFGGVVAERQRIWPPDFQAMEASVFSQSARAISGVDAAPAEAGEGDQPGNSDIVCEEVVASSPHFLSVESDF